MSSRRFVYGLGLCGILLGVGAATGDTVLPKQTCPVGFVLDGDRCISHVALPADARCGGKSELLDGECVYRDKKGGELVCPAGSVAKGKSCVETVVGLGEYYCESGYVLENGECVSSELTPVEYSCEGKGEHLNGLECLRSEKVKATSTCPLGFSFDSKSNCVGYERMAPMAECPKEYVLTEGQCVRSDTKKIRSVCPKGYHLSDGDRCERIEKVKSEKVCPGGFEGGDGKKCEKEVIVPAIPRCGKDSVFVNNECVSTETLSPELSCKDYGPQWGSTKDGFCEMTVKTKPTLLCPPGTSLTKKKTCELLTTHATTFGCPPGYTLAGQDCIRESIKPLIASCPKGFHDLDGVCQRATKTPAELVCEVGQLNHKDCLLVETVPVQTLCESGELLGTGECVTTDVTPITYSCPKHATVDAAGQCIVERHVHATPLCPPNSTLSRKGLCEIVVPTQPDVKCPKHFFLTDNGKCARTITAPSILSCPNGFELKEDTCMKWLGGPIPETLALPLRGAGGHKKH